MDVDLETVFSISLIAGFIAVLFYQFLCWVAGPVYPWWAILTAVMMGLAVSTFLDAITELEEAMWVMAVCMLSSFLATLIAMIITWITELSVILTNLSIFLTQFIILSVVASVTSCGILYIKKQI